MQDVRGRYRLRDDVEVQGELIYRTDPIAVTRVNPSAQSLIAALSREQFRSVEEIAHSTEVEAVGAESLLRGLFERGFLAWNPETDPAYYPAVSIVVTVRNEAASIAPLLKALSALEYPDYEVVFVDDGSTDGTRDRIRSSDLAASGTVQLVTVGSPSEPLGIGASRNVGVENARSHVVAFTDADCRPETDWLSTLVPALANHDVVGGRVRPVDNGETIREYESAHSSLDMGPHASPVKRDSTTPYLPTANLVGKRDVFETHPFPERNVAEDVSVCWEALRGGFDLVYYPAAQVKHDFGDWANFLRRRLSYGGSEALLAKSYGHPGSVPIPIISALGLILLLTWTIVGQIVPTDFPVSGGLLGSIIFGFLVDPGAQSITGLRKTPIRRMRVGQGFLRSSISRMYGLAKEITRYYSIPLLVLGGVTALLGYDQLATTLIGLAAFAVGISLVTDLIVQRPMNVIGYSTLYVADHLTYQLGAYRGAVAERSFTHLNPLNRFDLTR